MKTTPTHRRTHQRTHQQPRPRPLAPKTTAPKKVDAFESGPKKPGALGTGAVSVDLNGTKYTKLEGSAGNSHISIESKRAFDPLKEPGIALTNAQAKALGVKVGDTVAIRDSVTNKVVTATFYDSAGKKPGHEQSHFEVSPALADQLGIRYRDSKGNVRDAVFNSAQMDGRFSIERASP